MDIFTDAALGMDSTTDVATDALFDFHSVSSGAARSSPASAKECQGWHIKQALGSHQWRGNYYNPDASHKNAQSVKDNCLLTKPGCENQGQWPFDKNGSALQNNTKVWKRVKEMCGGIPEDVDLGGPLVTGSSWIEKTIAAQQERLLQNKAAHDAYIESNLTKYGTNTPDHQMRMSLCYTCKGNSDLPWCTQPTMCNGKPCTSAQLAIRLATAHKSVDLGVMDMRWYKYQDHAKTWGKCLANPGLMAFKQWCIYPDSRKGGEALTDYPPFAWNESCDTKQEDDMDSQWDVKDCCRLTGDYCEAHGLWPPDGDKSDCYEPLLEKILSMILGPS